MKLNQLADIDLKKAVSDAVQTVKCCYMSVHVRHGDATRVFMQIMEENDTLTGTTEPK